MTTMALRMHLKPVMLSPFQTLPSSRHWATMFTALLNIPGYINIGNIVMILHPIAMDEVSQ